MSSCRESWRELLAHAETDHLLGVHIVGSRAGDPIAEAAVAMALGAAAEDLTLVVHAHPPTMRRLLAKQQLARRQPSSQCVKAGVASQVSVAFIPVEYAGQAVVPCGRKGLHRVRLMKAWEALRRVVRKQRTRWHLTLIRL